MCRLGPRRVGNALCLDADLPQLSKGGGNCAAEKEAGLRRCFAANERRSRCIQHAVDLGQQRTKVRAEAGRENDRVKALGGRLLEVEALVAKACDVAPQLDSSVAYRIERADLDERDAPRLLDRLEGVFGRALQAELFDRADRESKQGRV